MAAQVFLNPNREKSLLRRHPWVFSKAIGKIKGKPQIGDTLDIYTSKGQWLAKGAYSPNSQITLRVSTWHHHR
jgi:23S rRNA (cytosine1962-C5)-methyltransferase